MIGAIAFVGAFQLLTDYAYAPVWVKTVCSCLSGTYLGTRIKSWALKSMGKRVFYLFVIVFALMLYSVISSRFLTKASGMELGAVLLGMGPGGIAEMSLIALDMGFSSAFVTFIQVIRVLVVITVLPWFGESILKRSGEDLNRTEENEGKMAEKPEINNKHLLITLSIGFFFGLIGKLTELSAATLCFSMLAVSSFNALTGKAVMPKLFKYIAQSSNGVITGSRLIKAELILMKQSLPVFIAAAFGWILYSALVAVLLHKITKMPLKTCLFATAPGGMNDMAYIAEEYGGNMTVVFLAHIIRVSTTIALYPAIVNAILALF